MTYGPSRSQLDTMLTQAKTSMRQATREDAIRICRERKAWMEANWPPAVAKAATQVLRDAFASRFGGRK